jgi:hypothetical protein
MTKQQQQHYFASDGNYGDADGIGVFDTTNWTDREWELINDATDGRRLRIARNINTRHADSNGYIIAGAIGAVVSIHWTDDSDDDSTQNVYVSFSDEVFDHRNEPMEKDIFGVPDVDIFYYLNAEEQEALGRAISSGDTRVQFNEEWFIDLDWGIEYATPARW